MASKQRKKRILIVTPEITYLPRDMGNMANRLHAKAGGLADVSAGLVSALFDLGADVHVALPHYRQMFNVNIGRFISEELRIYKSKLSDDRIHLAEDRIFYYRDKVYDQYGGMNVKLALTFQREVINNIIPRVNPDIIHCNDWMTGLIPAVAKRQNILSLFTLHNIHTMRVNLEMIEDHGIDAREFWPYLYFDRPPSSMEESYQSNPVDLLVSGVFSADAINTVSPTFLKEMVQGIHPFVKPNLLREIQNKVHNGQAAGILNSPDPNYDPNIDQSLPVNYTAEDAFEKKKEIKTALQQKLGLDVDPNAALFFWPSRLDPNQKGCQLLTEILYDVVASYYHKNLQVVFVANGPFQRHFHEIVQLHHVPNRICVCDFDEVLSRWAYAASDFLFMPSLFEPCGLPQMIGPIYGCLPIARDTGGLHDTVFQLEVSKNQGNGFLFRHYDVHGLRWAIDQAMKFHDQPEKIRKKNLKRIMEESSEQFNHDVTAKKYIEIYRKILNIDDPS